MVLCSMVLLADLGMYVLFVFSGVHVVTARARMLVRCHRLLRVLRRRALLVLVVALLDDHHLRSLVEAPRSISLCVLGGLRLVAAVGRLAGRRALRRRRRDIQSILQTHLVDPLLECVLELPVLFQRDGLLLVP